ncbi:MAG: RHS repeat-associated core domain-containing protein, partial [bacterium]|nr:RHS repeat-associated core domain-containing protein [bacterium]
KQPRDFGVGWSLDIRQGSYRNNRLPGDGWQLQTGFVACDSALESKSHLTVVRLSDQEVYRFALRLFSGEPRVGGGGCQADARFDFIDGPLPGTTLEILANDQVFWETGTDRVIDVDTFETYEPEDVRLTTRDGRIFELNLTDGVTLVEDLNGNQLLITPAGITHSSGKGIVFERDAEGRITKITDPLDRATSYAYDAAGDLVSFTDRAGAVSRFTYDGTHRLLDIENPRGVRPIRNEYNADGRLVRHMDAFGRVIELGHDLNNRREIMTNRLGASRVLEYDARGNVVKEINELGKVTARIFDHRDNLLSEKDPIGRVTTFTYTDHNDIATLTDAQGNTTIETYNQRGQLLTVTDPRGGVASYAYDSRGNRLTTTDALGKTSISSYDEVGNLVTITDVLGQTTRFEYDIFGNRLKETDVLGHETISTYDGTGNRLSETRTRTLPDGSTQTLDTSFVYNELDRLTATIAADGGTTSTSYDLLGKVAGRTDSLGRVTTMIYDSMGRLLTTAYTDGNTTHRQYDDEGRMVAQIDRAGRTTGYTYDLIGRLLAVSLTDGNTTSNTYDDAGQLVTTTDARGNTTTFTYDDAGNLSSIIDALGHVTSYAYDENGNQIAMTDALQRTTTYAYDALNRPIITTFPDGTTTESHYDSLGRRTSETDQAGLTTTFGYDALGRLTAVSDALGETIRYSYDEVGNRLTQTDANNQNTRFEYDRLRRQTARVFPDGSRETMTYNSDGTLASHTDFGGDRRSFHYDTNQQLVRRAYSDGSEVIFSYTATGKRAAATDTRGTTSYTYDSRDQLIEKTDPTSNKLEYTYDPQGNRTTLTVTGGSESFTTAYAYDALNRLVTVTDSRGGVTNLAYDPVGNTSSLVLPNAITTRYTYDDLNRLAELRSETSIGEVLQSYQLTVGPAGARTRINEHDGTARHYQYDALDRLTQERVMSSANELVYQSNFTYDPVGNRLAHDREEGAAPTTVTSTYDTRDRLLSADGTTYSWSQDGNLTARNGIDYINYQWNFDNRLTAVTLDDGTLVEYTYDVDGNRVRSALTPAGGSTTHVDYIVDTTGFLSHVVADVVGNNIETLYGRAGDQLIAMYRPASGDSRFVHVDGIGSVRLLSDEAAAVTDRYTYSAFGTLTEHIGQTVQPYMFAGERLDLQTDLYHLRARWLDVETGRFVSVDPASGNVENPLSFHQYLYAEANPVNNIDPAGLQSASVAESITVSAATAEMSAASLLLSLYTVEQICRAHAFAGQTTPTMSALASAMMTTYLSGQLDPCDGDGWNVMRVQLQDESTKFGVQHTHAIPVTAPASEGVKAIVARAALEVLFWSTTPETVPWFPQKERTEFMFAIIKQSIRIGKLVRGGGIPIQMSWSEEFGPNDFYRVDLENVRGHNLRN